MRQYPKQHQTLAGCMLRAVVLNPGPRNYKMYTGDDIIRFLNMCDRSILPIETLLREYSQAAVKLSSIDRSARLQKGWGPLP